MRTIPDSARKVALVALVACQSAIAADWKFGAGLTARETYTDNVRLSAAGGSSSDWVTEISPYVSVGTAGGRLKVNANYSMQNLFYAQGRSRNATYHQLSARANARLTDQEVFMDAHASIQQALISPLGPAGVDNVNATGNLASVRSTSLSPYWTHRFGSTATLDARYTVSNVQHSAGGFSGSTNSGARISLASGAAFRRVHWALSHADQSVSFAGRPDARFSATSATVGYAFTPRFRVNGTIGWDDNSYQSIGTAATAGPSWNVGISWAPSSRTSLSLGYGHRYFGNNWLLAFKSRGAHFNWTADYSESVTTANSEFSAQTEPPVGGPFPGPGPGFGPTPGNPYDPTFILTNRVFLNKRFGTGVSWAKGKLGANLRVYRAIQTAQEAGLALSTDDVFQFTSIVKQMGIHGGLNWRITELLSSYLSASVTHNSFPDVGRNDRAVTLQVGLSRTFSPHLSGNLLVRRQVRSSDQDADYTENALSGAVTYRF
jgi:hypothetical protein